MEGEGGRGGGEARGGRVCLLPSPIFLTQNKVARRGKTINVCGKTVYKRPYILNKIINTDVHLYSALGQFCQIKWTIIHNITMTLLLKKNNNINNNKNNSNNNSNTFLRILWAIC